MQSVEALYSRENCLKIAGSINASECNAFTILFVYQCKYSYTTATSKLYTHMCLSGV